MARRLRTRLQSLSVTRAFGNPDRFYCSACGAHYDIAHFADGHAIPIG
jgi:hypothetical protein